MPTIFPNEVWILAVHLASNDNSCLHRQLTIHLITCMRYIAFAFAFAYRVAIDFVGPCSNRVHSRLIACLSATVVAVAVATTTLSHLV